MSLCRECFKPLTATEEHYYGTRCEQCEEAWSERVSQWRRGGEDPELDKMFGAPKETPTRH